MDTAAEIFAAGRIARGLSWSGPGALGAVLDGFLIAPPGIAEAGRFFRPDAWRNPRYLQGAVKSTAAAMLCYVLYHLLDWQSIHTCVITCFIVSLETVADTMAKMLLRIAGCLLGALAGFLLILFVVPYLTSIGGLMLVVFLGMFIGGWIATGPERIGYVGFQFALALLMSLLQGSGPSLDMTTARDRVLGILLGNVMVFLITVTVWPVSIAERIDHGMATVRRLLRQVLAADAPRHAAIPLAQAQEALGQLERDLDLARLEPPGGLAGEPGWLDARRMVACRLAGLAGPALLAVGSSAAQTAGALLDGTAAPVQSGSGMPLEACVQDLLAAWPTTAEASHARP